MADNLLHNLQELFLLQQSSPLRFAATGRPWIAPGWSAFHGVVHQLVARADERSAQLAGLIEDCGGAVPPRRCCPDEQYMAYTSLAHLLPALLEDQRRQIAACQVALAAAQSAGPHLKTILEDHLGQHQADLDQLAAAVPRPHTDRSTTPR